MNKGEKKDTPFPLRLGPLKPHLRQLAHEDDRSTHAYILRIIKQHLKNKGIKLKDAKAA